MTLSNFQHLVQPYVILDGLTNGLWIGQFSPSVAGNLPCDNGRWGCDDLAVKLASLSLRHLAHAGLADEPRNGFSTIYKVTHAYDSQVSQLYWVNHFIFMWDYISQIFKRTFARSFLWKFAHSILSFILYKCHFSPQKSRYVRFAHLKSFSVSFFLISWI